MNDNVPILKPIMPSINLRMEELAREDEAKNSVITYVFKDENETEYLVTLFPKADPQFAIRGYRDRTWGVPVPLIRKEVSK